MKKVPSFFSEVPVKPDHNPVKKAIESSGDRPEVAAALKLFVSMPPSTGVLANPVRHHHPVPCGDTQVELEIRSFTIRGRLHEDDIVAGTADVWRVVGVGLFGRELTKAETKQLKAFVTGAFDTALDKPLELTAAFMKAYPKTPPDVAIQNYASVRKAQGKVGAIHVNRNAGELLGELIRVHMENVALAGAASYMRSVLKKSPKMTAGALKKATVQFIRSLKLKEDPFRVLFSCLLRTAANDDVGSSR